MFSQQSLNQLLGIVCSVFDAYSAVLFVADNPETNKYRLASHFSLGSEIRENAQIAPGQGLIGWVLRNSEPLLVDRLDRKGDCLGYYDAKTESKIKAFMGCPLDQGRGVLCVDSKKKYSFSAKDQKILHQFVQFIDGIISDDSKVQNDRIRNNLYAGLLSLHALREKYPQWARFMKSFLDVLSQTSGLAYCFLAARDERGENYFLENWNTPVLQDDLMHLKFEIGSGLIGWVFKNDKPVIAEDKKSGPLGTPLFGGDIESPLFKTVLCLPLRVHKKVRGVLVLADENSVSLPRELKEFLQTASQYLAIFLENLYLKNRLTQRRAKP